jgi:prepilin-type N-terminal cleavage/methylation domain-containing protein
MNALLRRPTARARSSGFTMIEVLFAILIIGVLLGLLIVGVRRGIGFVKGTAERQMVQGIAMGISQFEKEFGFHPPLVKELPWATNSNQLLPMRPTPGGGGAKIDTSGAQYRIEVYDLNNDADKDLLRTVVIDATNPLEDNRYSVRTIAIYLAGALEVGYNAARNNPSAANFLPMDGVKGPGLYRPRLNGTFDLPSDLIVAASGSGTSAKRGRPHESFINLGGSSLKIIHNAEDDERRDVYIADRNGVPIRYYFWLPVDPAAPATNPPNPLGDLRIPAMVGRNPADYPMIKTPPERDLTVNAALRSAKHAIVAAGPNKAFGDEAMDDLRKIMRVGPGVPDLEVRQMAEEDNIVEAGE